MGNYFPTFFRRLPECSAGTVWRTGMPTTTIKGGSSGWSSGRRGDSNMLSPMRLRVLLLW